MIEKIDLNARQQWARTFDTARPQEAALHGANH